ncbi:hypothetical protein AGMMS50212_10530 [Spirochaetia bacterium]|nr:hypothetical protein AGMMS50212_10530 [Spirochaetia bacterium]
MTSIRQLLADNIRTYRHKLGLSQGKLAEKVNTATNYIALIEGAKKFPSANMLERIAASLEIDVPELFALAPIQRNWESLILADIEKLITNKIDALNHNKRDCV